MSYSKTEEGTNNGQIKWNYNACSGQLRRLIFWNLFTSHNVFEISLFYSFQNFRGEPETKCDQRKKSRHLCKLAVVMHLLTANACACVTYLFHISMCAFFVLSARFPWNHITRYIPLVKITFYFLLNLNCWRLTLAQQEKNAKVIQFLFLASISITILGISGFTFIAITQTNKQTK